MLRCAISSSFSSMSWLLLPDSWVRAASVLWSRSPRVAQTLPLMSAFLGWLTLYQGRVKDRSLRRFLEGHSDEINAERLDRDVRFWFLSLGFHEDSTHRSDARPRAA